MIICAVLAVALVACGNETPAQTGEVQSLQVSTIQYMPNAYVNESFDLRDVINMEEGVEYSATAFYVLATYDDATNTFSSVEYMLEVKDLCYTPVETTNTVVTITATRGAAKASKTVLIPTIIRADPLDDLLKSDGTHGTADGGITKSVNNDPMYIQGENSATSLHVSFNSVDPHPWGNTFISLHNEEVQKHFTDQEWKNAILTFWIYNPNDLAIEFQLRLADDFTGLNVDWSNAEGPHKQIAAPGQWTQIFFPLRKLGVLSRITADQYHSCAVNMKFRYEGYSTTESYAFDFYLDNLDVVDGSVYPEIDNSYVLSDETVEQGWENMQMDIGWQGVYTEYNYENTMGEGSTCSLKAFFNNDKAQTNNFICLSPQQEFEELPDMTGGKFSAYFKFENLEEKVSLDILNDKWAVSNRVDFKLEPVGDGWYYGEVDMENLQVGTGLNTNIIRIRLIFHGVNMQSVAYVDTCKFEYKKVDKVLEDISADWINMSSDTGPFYCNTTFSFVTTHLKGSNTVRSLKLVAPSNANGRYTWSTQAAAENGELSALPNMTKGTLGAWFYFGNQAPSASLIITSDTYMGSNSVNFVFTQNGGNGWYYGELHGSDIKFVEDTSAKAVYRLTLVIPAGYTVYVDNLNWKANTENTLVPVVDNAPVVPKANFVAGENLTVEFENSKKLSSMSLDYKITSGEKFSLALMVDWNNFYGVFDFTAEGTSHPIDGVSTEALSNGYIRATFDLHAITKYSGKPSGIVTMLYVRGDWTTANGIIENVKLTVDENAEPEPEVPENGFKAGEDQNIAIGNTQALETPRHWRPSPSITRSSPAITSTSH